MGIMMGLFRMVINCPPAENKKKCTNYYNIYIFLAEVLLKPLNIKIFKIVHGLTLYMSLIQPGSKRFRRNLVVKE